MQLKLSLVTIALLSSSAIQADNYISVQYLQYDETQNRTSISAPSFIINQDFGTDYTLNASLVIDAVGGASQTYYDGASGASAFSRGKGVDTNNVSYGNVGYKDTRAAGSLSLITRFDNRDELTVGLNRSSESDFYSTELSTNYMHWLDNLKNSALSLGVSYQANEILAKCNESYACDAGSGASKKMTADMLNVQASYLQNINSESYIKPSLFYISNNGYLSNPYLNIVRNYDSVLNTADIVAERRPDNRTAFGASIKYANALTKNLSLHLNYRYYSDDWDIDSHTIDTDIYYEANKKWLLKIGLRAYTQSRANFYNSDKSFFTNEIYASSDERLSSFNATTYKTSVEYNINDGLSVNFGANYYTQDTGLDASYLITGFTYKY